MSDDLCQCPACGRTHKRMEFGMPPWTREVRAKALEEAALTCNSLLDELPDSFTEAIAECMHAIRALKEQPL